MATARTITNMTAVTAGNLTDAAVFPVDDANGNTRKTTIAQLRTQLNTFAQSTANTAMFTYTGHSVTASSSTVMMSFAGTWNTSGTPTALKVAITNTTSNAASLLLNLLGGASGTTSMFSVTATGKVAIANGTLSLGGSPPSASAGDEVLLAGGAIRCTSDLYVARPTNTAIQFQFSNTVRSYSMTVTAGGALTFVDNTAGATMVTMTNTTITIGASIDLQFGRALVALGGGSAATLGTVGGSGPATAGQNTWQKILDSTGATAWVPVWK